MEVPGVRGGLEGFEEVRLFVALGHKEFEDHWLCFVWLKLGELE